LTSSTKEEGFCCRKATLMPSGLIISNDVENFRPPGFVPDPLRGGEPRLVEADQAGLSRTRDTSRLQSGRRVARRPFSLDLGEVAFTSYDESKRRWMTFDENGHVFRITVSGSW
jgi:hypothetical protein